jgi:hypothetical protein
MNELEKTFQDMAESSVSCLDLYKSHWIDNLVIAPEVEELRKIVKELGEAAKVQGDTKTEGEVAQKSVDLSTLGKLIYKLACNLGHFADKTNNKVLSKIVSIPESKFTKGEEKKVFIRWEAVLSAGREYLPQMGNYGITAANLDNLDAQLAKLKDKPKMIDAASSERKSATRSIKSITNNARALLKSLDKAIKGMMSDEKFLAAWFDARKIKGRHYKGNKNKATANGDVPPVK